MHCGTRHAQLRHPGGEGIHVLAEEIEGLAAAGLGRVKRRLRGRQPENGPAPARVYILEFEFLLPPKGNNGLGIHYPGDGDPAYSGMELQILDDSADKYKTLKPWQYHGSVYGLVPVKRGYQKPVGEWNVQEVTAIGPRIKVVLNGTSVIDTDLSKLKQTADIFLVTSAMSASWMKRIDEQGPDVLLQLREPVNKFPDQTAPVLCVLPLR